MFVRYLYKGKLQTKQTFKPLELGTWTFETMFKIQCVLYVTYHISNVTCHILHVTWHYLVLELVPWYFEPIFTIPWVSHVRFHLSCVMCQVSHVTKKNLKIGLACQWRVCYQQSITDPTSETPVIIFNLSYRWYLVVRPCEGWDWDWGPTWV